MKSIQLILSIFLSLFSVFIADYTLATNGRRRPADESWEQQGPSFRPRIEQEDDDEDSDYEEEYEEKEEYDEKEAESDEDGMEIEDSTEDELEAEESEETKSEEYLGLVEYYLDEYEDLSQDQKNKKLLEASSKDLAEVEALLSLNADVNTKSGTDGFSQTTPLFNAAESGNLSIVKRLLKEEAININGPATGVLAGATPLWVAVQKNNKDIVFELLRHGAAVTLDNPSDTVKDIGLPLLLAIENGNPEIVELLLEHGVDKDTIVDNTFPLFTVIKDIDQDDDNYAEIAKMLITHGANVNQAVPADADEDAGETPLYKAVYYGFTSIVRELLKNGADLLVRPNGDSTKLPLYIAKNELIVEEDSRFEEIYILLLDQLVKDLDRQDSQGNTLLHYLVEINDDVANQVAKDVVARGGDLLIKNRQGIAPLAKAIKNRNAVVTRLFLNPIEQDDLNQALVAAIENGLLSDVLRLLKQENVDVNFKDNGITPLMHAAKQNESVALVMIDKLIEKGANVDENDNNGKTALAYAAEAGKKQSFRRLLAKGADPSKIPGSITLSSDMQAILHAHQSIEEDDGEEAVDPITGDDISDLPDSQKITLFGNTYSKKTIMNHILSKIGSKNLDEILDPITRRPIGTQIATSLAQHFGIQFSELISPALDDDLQQIPNGMDEGTYNLLKHPEHGNVDQALNLFKNMIATDTLRALVIRLQEKTNSLQMYPSGDPSWDQGEREFIEREVEALESAKKTKLEGFGYQQE